MITFNVLMIVLVCPTDIQKLALVMGNSRYAMPGWIRESSVSEAQAFAAQLREMDWTGSLLQYVVSML
jgi:hypothetical protein